jgi:hypothetical protein
MQLEQLRLESGKSKVDTPASSQLLAEFRPLVMFLYTTEYWRVQANTTDG